MAIKDGYCASNLDLEYGKGWRNAWSGVWAHMERRRELLRRDDEKRLEALEMWVWRRREKIS